MKPHKDPTNRKTIPIACTLEPAAMPDRLDDWKRVLATASGREPLGDDGDGSGSGVRLRFDTTDPAFAGELATLAAAEQGCCAFFRFAIVIEGGGAIYLDVRAPADAADVTAALFGASV